MAQSATISSRTRGRGVLTVIVAFLALLVFLAGVDVMLGPAGTRVPPGELPGVLLSRLPVPAAWKPQVADQAVEAIVWEVRLPRICAAAFVGALLAMAGVAFQGLLMNPLADPYTVGASAGAAVGAAAAEVLGIGMLGAGIMGTAWAFLAAIGASVLVYTLARVQGRVSVQTFLLAGVVVGTMLWSLIPLLMVLAGRADDLQRIYFYLIGSLQGADWTRVLLLAPLAALSGTLMWAWSRELDLMTFGEESALHLGVPVEAYKRLVLGIGSLATAAAVSVGGIIGFVGLVVPHLVRRLVGPSHRGLIPAAALGGAALLVISDAIVRVWLNDMPVGVITAIVGAPVFCVLIRRRRAAAW